MNNPILTFFEMLLPVILSAFVLSLLLFIKKTNSDSTKLQFSLLGFVNFESEIQKVWVIRSLILFISVSLLFVPAFRDYTEFFPTHVQMQVFFDDEGVKTTLSQFSEAEKAALKIKKDWQPDKAEYLTKLNDAVKAKVKIPFRFQEGKGECTSKGDTSFEVTKVKKWGWQRYRIQASKGNLKHSYDVPGQPSQSISSTFELLDTDANLIELSMYDVYLGYTVIMRPEFKQVFSLSPTVSLYDHHLSAVTKIHFFPYIDIGKSIYLVRYKQTDTYFPVGYAIYSPD